MTTLIFLGHRLHPLEPIAVIGEALGLKRTKAFDMAKEWPVIGDPGGRLVVVPALADQLGIPYEIETEEGGSE